MKLRTLLLILFALITLVAFSDMMYNLYTHLDIVLTPRQSWNLYGLDLFGFYLGLSLFSFILKYK